MLAKTRTVFKHLEGLREFRASLYRAQAAVRAQKRREARKAYLLANPAVLALLRARAAKKRVATRRRLWRAKVRAFHARRFQAAEDALWVRFMKSTAEQDEDPEETEAAVADFTLRHDTLMAPINAAYNAYLAGLTSPLFSGVAAAERKTLPAALSVYPAVPTTAPAKLQAARISAMLEDAPVRLDFGLLTAQPDYNPRYTNRLETLIKSRTKLATTEELIRDEDAPEFVVSPDETEWVVDVNDEAEEFGPSTPIFTRWGTSLSNLRGRALARAAKTLRLALTAPGLVVPYVVRALTFLTLTAPRELFSFYSYCFSSINFFLMTRIFAPVWSLVFAPILAGLVPFFSFLIWAIWLPYLNLHCRLFAAARAVFIERRLPLSIDYPATRWVIALIIWAFLLYYALEYLFMDLFITPKFPRILSLTRFDLLNRFLNHVVHQIHTILMAMLGGVYLVIMHKIAFYYTKVPSRKHLTCALGLCWRKKFYWGETVFARFTYLQLLEAETNEDVWNDSDTQDWVHPSPEDLLYLNENLTEEDYWEYVDDVEQEEEENEWAKEVWQGDNFILPGFRYSIYATVLILLIETAICSYTGILIAGTRSPYGPHLYFYAISIQAIMFYEYQLWLWNVDKYDSCNCTPFHYDLEDEEKARLLAEKRHAIREYFENKKRHNLKRKACPLPKEVYVDPEPALAPYAADISKLQAANTAFVVDYKKTPWLYAVNVQPPTRSVLNYLIRKRNTKHAAELKEKIAYRTERLEAKRTYLLAKARAEKAQARLEKKKSQTTETRSCETPETKDE
jgi:hypothetical protein